MIFRRGRADEPEDDDEEQEIEYVMFQGATNGQDPNLKENARLVQAGLVPAKEIVTDALSRRAERIRIEPKGERSMVGLYIDGVPYAGRRLSKQQGLAVTQMLKLLAGLDIRDRSKPQKGGIKAELSNVKYEVGVESMPVGGGAERLTVNIRNPKISLERPDELGFNEKMRAKLREMGTEDTGVICACGPRDSGVTLTMRGIMRAFDSYLYALFNIADLGGRDLPNVAQFAHNPDEDLETIVIRLKRNEAHLVLVDPIRNAEQAKAIFEQQQNIAIVSEFAARDVATGVLQLIEWTGDPKAVAQGLRALVSAKLIRLICDKCREAYKPNPKLLAKMGLPPETKLLYRPPRPIPPEELEEQGLEEPEPCPKCNDMRYIGRTGLFEMLEMTDSMRQLVARKPTAADIKAQMRKEGMQTFQQDGLRLVAEGKTSLEELQRIFKPAG